MRLGMGEMLVVLVVVLLVFGPNKLPMLGDALGKGIRNFKKAADSDEPVASGQAHASPALPPASQRAAATTPGAPAGERAAVRES